MIGKRSLLRNQRAAAAIEFAIAAPVLVIFLIGIAQMGLLYLASAELRNAVGTGARYATIYPRPSTTQIQAKITSNSKGLQAAYLTTPSIVYGNDGTADYADISMSYTPPVNFVLFQVPGLTLTEKRRVFLQPT